MLTNRRLLVVSSMSAGTFCGPTHSAHRVVSYLVMRVRVKRNHCDINTISCGLTRSETGKCNLIRIDPLCETSVDSCYIFD